MNCGWLMYRTPSGETFNYKCGYYQQTHGQMCDTNPVDGPTATRFVLGVIRQRLLQPHLWAKLETRLREIALASGEASGPSELEIKRRELAEVERDFSLAKKNLAFAESKAQFHAVSEVVDELAARKEAISAQIDKLKRKVRTEGIEREIQQALNLLDSLRTWLTLPASALRKLVTPLQP